jgi:hypothetical protein
MSEREREKERKKNERKRKILNMYNISCNEPEKAERAIKLN